MNHTSQNRIHKPKAVSRDSKPVSVDFHVTSDVNELLNGDQQGGKMIKSPPTSQRKMTTNYQKLGEQQILLARHDSYFEMNHNQLSPSSLLTYQSTKTRHSGKSSPDSQNVALNQTTKTADFGVSNVSVSSDANDNVGYQGAQKREQASRCCCHCQQDGIPGGLTSATGYQIVLFVFCVVVIVFAMVVLHLHLRIQALEMRDNRSSKCPAKSDTGSVMNGVLIKKSLIANSRMIHRNHMDQSRGIASKSGRDINIPRLIDSDKIAYKNVAPRKRRADDTDDEILPKTGAYDQDQGRVANEMIFDGAVGGENIPTGLSHGNVHSSSRLEDAYMMAAKYHSFNIEVRNGLIDVTSDSSENAESMKFERQNLSPKKLSDLSRTARSAKRKRVVFNKGYRREELKVETFVGSFFEHFNYDNDFKPSNQNCITVDKWGVNVTACRDNTVMFFNKNTYLPFLRPDTTKESKLLDKTADGKFRVKMYGDYLLHFSIMIVDVDQKEDFLALYVNNQAMLTCPHGGFLCPDINDEYNKHFRICNINGLLELNKGDTLSIRTMQPNVTVRIDDKIRVSYFKAVLLKHKRKQ